MRDILYPDKNKNQAPPLCLSVFARNTSDPPNPIKNLYLQLTHKDLTNFNN
jgi:hypothetical protein